MKTLSQIKILIIQHSQYPTWLPMLMIFMFALFLSSCSDDTEILPKLNTIEASDTDITSTTAVLKGEVLSLGNMRLEEYGIELSKNQLFSPSTTKSFDTAPEVGTFQAEFTDLTPNTLYYYKAYIVVNTAQVYSQNREEFTTKQ
jgi:hypothetical protein